jgi:hypothetical protein
MHGSIAGNFVILFIVLIAFNQVTAKCLYPPWETTCQKYCLDNKFYSIQMNQCWSEDPKNLRCKCNDQDFTEIIKALFTINNDESFVPENPV